MNEHISSVLRECHGHGHLAARVQKVLRLVYVNPHRFPDVVLVGEEVLQVELRIHIEIKTHN